jgi:hypothetical protein
VYNDGNVVFKYHSNFDDDVYYLFREIQRRDVFFLIASPSRRTLQFYIFVGIKRNRSRCIDVFLALMSANNIETTLE